MFDGENGKKRKRVVILSAISHLLAATFIIIHGGFLEHGIWWSGSVVLVMLLFFGCFLSGVTAFYYGGMADAPPDLD